MAESTLGAFVLGWAAGVLTVWVAARKHAREHREAAARAARYWRDER